MAGNQVDHLNKSQGLESESDFKENPNFRAAVEKFGEAKATEAYKKAEQIAISELVAAQERPEASGHLVEKNSDLEHDVIPKELGAKKTVNVTAPSGENELESAIQKRVSQLAASFLSDDRKIDINTSDPYLLTQILNGGAEAQEALKKYLDTSKN